MRDGCQVGCLFYPNHVLPDLLLKLLSSEGQSEVFGLLPSGTQEMVVIFCDCAWGKIIPSL